MNGRQKANLMIILIISISALTVGFVSAALTGDYVASQTINSQNEDAKKLLTVYDGNFTANHINTVNVVQNYTNQTNNTNSTPTNTTNTTTNDTGNDTPIEPVNDYIESLSLGLLQLRL